MKIKIEVLLLFGLLFNLSFSQKTINANPSEHAVQGKSTFHRICINEKLKDPSYQLYILQNTAKLNPNLYRKILQKKIEEKEIKYNVGDIKVFWAYNYATKTYDEITAKLVVIGNITNIWVDTNELANNHVTIVEINDLFKHLETSTPSGSRDPTKGILKNDEFFFGDPPNINSSGIKGQGDGKIDFLMLDIKDEFDPTNNTDFIAGFFNPYDQSPTYPISNRRDLLYIDTYPTIFFNETRDISMASQTMAHEFQHLIHFNYDPTALKFIDEACSQNAEILCGFNAFNGVNESKYFDSTNVQLFEWPDNRVLDYSRATLWLLYVIEQVGDDVTKALSQNIISGLSGIISSLNKISSPYSFFDLLKNWNVANFVNDRTLSTIYGYKYPVKGKPGGTGIKDPNISFNNETITSLGAKYYLFTAQSKDFKIKFSTTSDKLTIKMVGIGPSQRQVQELNPGIDYSIEEFATVYSALVFIITNTDSSSSAQYNIVASGKMIDIKSEEIAYDNGKPGDLGGFEYLFSSYTGNGFAVKFNPRYEKNVLKKVKLWLVFGQEFPYMTSTPHSAPKTFNLHIWDTKNDSTPGSDIIAPQIYTVPRPDSLPTNFLEIALDAYSQNLTNLPETIFIGFIENAYYPTYIGIDNFTKTNYSYALGLSDKSGWTPLNEMRICIDTGRISLSGWNLMIRAVFSYESTTGVQTIIEEKPGFSLCQNYPNPFNPETTIDYTLPESGFVNLTIFDLFGRKVKNLISENQCMGRYSVKWSGDDNKGRKAASGIYIYKLETGKSSRSKKLNFIK